MPNETDVRIKTNLATSARYTLAYLLLIFIFAIIFYISLQGFVSGNDTEGGFLLSIPIFGALTLAVGYLFLKALIGIGFMIFFNQDAVIINEKGLTVNSTPLTPGRGQILWKEIGKIELISAPLKKESIKLSILLKPSAWFMMIHLADPQQYWETHSIPSRLDVFCNEMVTRFYQLPDSKYPDPNFAIVCLPAKVLAENQDEIAKKFKQACPKAIFQYLKQN